MRLLFTTFTFAPQRNGVAEAVLAVAQGLSARGHQVTIATAWDPARVPEMYSPLEVVQFRLGSGADAPEEIARYQDFLASHPAEVVICHCWRAWNTDLAPPGLRRSRAKKVLVSHGYAAHWWIPQRRLPWGLGSWIRGLRYVFDSFQVARAFDHFVFLSKRYDYHRFVDHLLISKLKLEDYSIIPNGVPASYFEDSARALRDQWQAGERCVYLCVSAYDDAKDQKLALRAFLRARSPGLLVFVGNAFNDYSRELESIAGRSSSVLVLEDRGGSFVRECYAACDVFILPSRRETQPLTILQAMAAERPFISTPVGCVEELEGGCVVRDESAMADAMARWAAEPRTRETIGAAGRRAALAHHQWDHIVVQYEQLCERLAAAPRTAL